MEQAYRTFRDILNVNALEVATIVTVPSKYLGQMEVDKLITSVYPYRYIRII